MPRTLFVIFAILLGASLFAAENVDGSPVVPPLKTWKDVPATDLKPFKAPAVDRYELENGMVVFLLEDHDLPLIDLSMTLRFGDIHEPADKAGLADATANVMRSGGSEKYPGDKLDETLENM